MHGTKKEAKDRQFQIQEFIKSYPETARLLSQPRNSDDSETVARILARLGATNQSLRNDTKTRVRVVGRTQESSGPTPGRQLVARDPRNGRTRSGNAPRMRKFADRDGNLHHSTSFRNLQSYRSGRTSFERSNDLPIAHQFAPRHTEEVQYVDRDGERHVRIRFRQYLTSVSTPLADNLLAGDRFPYGVQWINPNALGGRPEQLAQVFEEYRFLSLAVEYHPVCAATTDGAILMYFTNNSGIPLYPRGSEELQRGFGAESSVCTSVFTPATLHIDPKDILKQYFDDDAGETELMSQGFVSIVAASDLTKDIDFGVVTIRGEIEFSGGELSYELPVRATTTATVTYTATVHDWLINDPVTWSTDVGSTTLPEIQFSGLADTPAALAGKIFVGVVRQVSAAPEQDWYTTDDEVVRDFAVGQAFVLRATGREGDLNHCNVQVFADFGSAGALSAAPVPDEINVPGQLVNASTATVAVTHTITLDCYYFSPGM